MLYSTLLGLSLLFNSAFSLRFDPGNLGDSDGIPFSECSNDLFKFGRRRPRERSDCGQTDVPCLSICDTSFNCFVLTCANKFTELTYLTIKELVMPNINFTRILQCGLKFCDRPSANLECEVANLLQSVLSTVPPCIFNRYYDAFQNGNYYECFLLLQRQYSNEAQTERAILDLILRRNRECRRKSITAICFVDPCTRECSVIDLPGCECSKRVCLYLPRQCLRFEEFLCLSFNIDDAIISEIDYFVPFGIRNFYCEIIKKYFKAFRSLSFEGKILTWLRIKFFVFNCIGYSISHLSSGAKTQVLELLLKTATSENDAFYLSYARALGIIGGK